MTQLNNDKLVSVLIPVFNVEPYVEEALLSITGQTWNNLEIIVVDDASDDNTFEIVLDLVQHDERIRVYRNQQNLKIASTLNRALSLANGQYIARMDGDDISAPDRIAKKVAFLESNPEYGLVGCSINNINAAGVVTGKSVYFADEKLLKSTLKYKTPVSHIWVARKTVYDRLNGYREMPVAQDYDFLLRMTTLGMQYTNLEDYFGYFFRIGRKGGSVNRFGIQKRKVHNYAWRLYKERLAVGDDSFSPEALDRILKPHPILEKVHTLSGKFLYLGVQAKSNRQHFRRYFYMLLSLISPYQIRQWIRNMKYRLLLRKFGK